MLASKSRRLEESSLVTRVCVHIVRHALVLIWLLVDAGLKLQAGAAALRRRQGEAAQQARELHLPAVGTQRRAPSQYDAHKRGKLFAGRRGDKPSPHRLEYE